MSNKRILLVEADAEISESLRDKLQREGYAVTCSPDAAVGPSPVRFGNCRIDPTRRLVTRDGVPVDLSHRAFDLLWALASTGGKLLPRRELFDRVWGQSWVGNPRTLDVHVRWLREKLEDDPSHPKWIVTVRGEGYRLRANDERDDASH